MIKQLTLLFLSGSIFGQDLLILKNDQEYSGKFDRIELEELYFILEGKEVAQSVQIKRVSLLKQGSVTLVKDGQVTLNSSDEASSYVINGVKNTKASVNEVRDIASKIINSSVHHKKPSIIDSPSIIFLLGLPTSFILGEIVAPSNQIPEPYMLSFMLGFIFKGINQHRKFNNFNMIDERDSFLNATKELNLGSTKRSIIFAEQLGELSAYRAIERHQFHMSSFRRIVTNYAVTMPIVPILFNLSPALVMAYPFIFPKIYDRYNQKTYFDKKMENYLASLPENEHEVFKSKHGPIVEDYKSQNRFNIKKKDRQYSLAQAGTIYTAGAVILFWLASLVYESISWG